MPPHLALLLLSPPPSAWSAIATVLLWLLASAAALEKVWGWFFGNTTKRIEALEAKSAGFMPQTDIKEELLKLGKDIAENQGKIKTQHDRNEDVANALNQRVSTLEQHNVSLTLLPGEVNSLRTNHAVLAAKVDALTNSVDKLGEKQDRHFSKLMDAVTQLSFTRGQMRGRGSDAENEE